MSRSRDIILASMVGTIIEWYGIFIFSSGADYISKVFYPFVTSSVAILLTLLTFALGFVTRPVGAYIFGHYGDRIGRKKMLLLTLMISGISTGLTGLIPGYASIGVAAIIILVILRLVLGFGLGGEWGGAMLLTLENFQSRRGFYSSFVQSTVGLGLLIGVFIFFPLAYYLPASAMIAYGWRIPFLFSFVILIIGAFIRLKVSETPVFENEIKSKKIQKSPFKVLMKRHWKGVLTGTILAGSSGNFFYFAIALLPVLMEEIYKMPVYFGLIGTAIFGIADIIFVFMGGMISDAKGRKIIIAFANILALVIIYPSVYLVSDYYFIIFITLFGVAHGLSYSPLGAMISEIFPADVRYSGNSAAYQYGNSFIGGPAPYVSDYLGGISYVLYPVFTVIFILIALGTVIKTGETRNLSMDVTDEVES
ncbi:MULTISPECIES: MFS transporter [Acidiplasma]|jgi:MFS family permease|uniref:MFS transporter permease n=2 Tax=Acidiplasma TaxID=507753 RepID=A0A0Q0XHI3_9ARCH|nr:MULTISPECIES: MFS transporter [Acidiplasma]KJE48879.1 MFS transporter permease [Acidiplasma sp. MBA-1]KPV47240.1 MFS transporter permease [Acidiplasma aeolicum]KQB34074.1 MFS transporter permease [Acidiplasma cupricumulans]KQB36161.1 MFS transporter permease [Acidiplasma aeolicum]WMT54280.1 MAG: MFS transporter [Acidiplasma sp.]